MRSGVFEPQETRLVRLLLGSHDSFVNVGANTGYYACLALSLGAECIAIEPEPVNARTLIENVSQNGWADRAIIYPMAAASSPRIVTLFGGGTGASLVPGWSGSRVGNGVQVPAAPLDVLVPESWNGRRLLVLVDVEGVELDVVMGAESLLGRGIRSTWLVEVNFDEHQPAGVLVNPRFAETFDFFFSRGFRAWTADEDLREIDGHEVQQCVQAGRNTLGNYNFIFSREDLGQELRNGL